MRRHVSDVWWYFEATTGDLIMPTMADLDIRGKPSVTMGIPLAWPLTAVEVSLFSLASCCPCACYIYTFTLQTGVTRYNLWKSVLKLCSTFVHCQTSFTCLLPATSPLWNWAVRRGLEFIKLSGAGRLQEAQIGLPFSVLSTDLW